MEAIVIVYNSSQDLNKRLQKQGPNRSHIVPKQYKSKTGSGVVPLILKSTSPVIWIHELSTKPALKNRYETLMSYFFIVVI